jgi:hypothetical protein
MKSYKTAVLAVALCGIYIVSAVTAEAASLYIDPAISNVLRGDTINLSVRLDTDEEIGECVNAVDAVITYSENIDLVDVSTGDSIFSIWVEQPTINKENRTVTFAGGIPNGYCGRVEGDPRLTNTILKMVFRSPGFSVGGSDIGTTARIDFDPATTAYLNDGQGTTATLATFGAQIELDSNPGLEINDVWGDEVAFDTVPPAQFSIALEKDRVAFGGKYFIVFNTTDKQTGIDQYQVMEEPVSKVGSFEWGRADAPWITIRSPYVLEDQSLNSVIRVKAIDKAGNEYIATLIPDESMQSFSLTQMIVIGAGLVIILLLLGISLTTIRSLRRRKQGKDTEVLADKQSTHESN